MNEKENSDILIWIRTEKIIRLIKLLPEKDWFQFSLNKEEFEKIKDLIK
jgi:hypothetical protein